MTLDDGSLKTNEFQQRRKLRLQQVREQSKDIAKKIRHRAKVEKLRHVLNVDSQKEKEYFKCQEKFVKRLEQIYSENLKNVGIAHQNVVNNNQQDCIEKKDLSKLRGKEAAADLKRRKQEKLDEQKKLLDRKLKAREAANELSREKSSTIIKNLAKSQTKKSEEEQNKTIQTQVVTEFNDKVDKVDIDKDALTTNDMATQWELPKEPSPTTLIRPENKDINNTDKTKKLNLFALSDEMTLNINEGLNNDPDMLPTKSSLNLVSEYLQNRSLRLRQPETIRKKPAEDLQSIKQTILRTRATKADGSVFDTVCHVLDEQVIPVPSWQFENNVGVHCHIQHSMPNYPHSQPSVPCPSSNPKQHLSKLSLNKLTKSSRNCEKTGYKPKSFRSTETEVRSEDSLNRKSSVTVYNHSTRDSRCMPCGDGRLVYREEKTDDDAYAQAYKEMTTANDIERERSSKQQQDLRHKIAIKKQNVEKEYRETLSFLNSFPKEVSASSIKTTYVDEEQQKLQRERHQKKLQEEFKKVQKDSCRHSCKHSRKKVIMPDRSPSKSPNNVEQDLLNKEYQYSWMPVPDSDGSLAIHTLPTTTKDKSNTVKFSQVNSYHEYRSRHKHTPPTKDNNNPTKRKREVETVVVEEKNESSDGNESNYPSETSSVDNLCLNKSNEYGERLSDADKIIIYKILNSRKDRKSKERKSQVNKKLSNINHVQGQSSVQANGQDLREFVDNLQQISTHDQLKEGIYKADNNGDNIEPACSNVLQKDNTTSKTNADSNSTKTCNCNSDLNNRKELLMELRKDGGDNGNMPPKSCENCKVSSNRHFAATSSSSFKTVENANRGNIHDNGFLKLIDDAGQESSKFYIGASGFLKDNNYEVIIQLRKKEDDKENKSTNVIQQVHSAQTQVFKNNSLNKTQTELNKDLEISNKNNICEEKLESQYAEVQNIENITATKLTDNNENSVKIVESEPIAKINTCDKGVDTSLQKSFAIPEHAPKTGSVLKPGTSTYTQTSFYSPIHRPPLMHLSSSTSTAYLSPPDVILPRFLRQNYDPTSEDVYDSSNSFNYHSEQYKNHAHNLGTDCRRRRCNCNKKDSNAKVLPLNKRSKSRRTVTATPPNTCRNSYKRESEELRYYKMSEPHQCHKQHKSKCSNRGEVKGNKYNKTRRRSSTKSADSPSVASLKNIITSTYSHKKINKSHLDPVVKKYIKKLLSLNKEGLKAIEIINQNCSEVTTPSNSIINVPSNIDKRNPLVDNKISLEQIKNVLKEEIIKSTQNFANRETKSKNQPKMQIHKRTIQTVGKKRSIHKVKSLNISKRVLKNNSVKVVNSQQCNPDSGNTKKSALSNKEQQFKDDNSNESNFFPDDKGVIIRKEKTSFPASKESKRKNKNNGNQNSEQTCASMRTLSRNTNIDPKTYCHKKIFQPSNRATTQFISSESEGNDRMTSYVSSCKEPYDISSQTNDIIESDINYIKIAEDKLHNIEKIADLTVKCSKRLSNLGKVLEEVRRNKTLVYSQISSNEISSGSDNKSDTSMQKDQKLSPLSNNDPKQNDDVLKSSTEICEKGTNIKDSFEFVQLLKDIPKPNVLKISSTSIIGIEKNPSSSNEQANLKCRPKPPPALTRHLKHGQDIFITPHELSTVVEVDSPMSIKMKSQSSRHNVNHDNQELTKINSEYTDDSFIESNIDKNQNYILKGKPKKADSSDHSKLRMMDMKQFNDIMLKPFITLQEYAKLYKIDSLDNGSNIEEALKELPINDVISNSENSLPDVMAELLKRNVISEPFKFESTSNNSTSLSSESTLSILALSKGEKKKLTDAKPKHQESLNETSESLSMSSNPDLENAFQKLGMGWASSTLKKTKERLALTSSSSTSSTNMRKFNIKSFNLEGPDLGTDSISSLMSIKDDSKRTSQLKVEDKLQNAVQQTSATQSMTVKDFLTQELAKKITFNNSNTKGGEDFVSLYETKMPEEIKNIETSGNKDEHSVTSTNSPNNNRARTSTPVQIFKSSTYRSSSSSNTSNGLFSNADDLSSVKVTSNSLRNHSTSDKEDLTIPNYSLKLKKSSDLSKSD